MRNTTILNAALLAAIVALSGCEITPHRSSESTMGSSRSETSATASSSTARGTTTAAPSSGSTARVAKATAGTSKSTTATTGLRGTMTPTAAKSTTQRSTDTRSRARDGFTWQGAAFPTGDESTSAIYLDKGLPKEIQSGQEFAYKIEVTNLTDMSLESVRITERMPEGLAYVSATPKPASTAKGVVQWELGGLPPRSKQIIEIRGKADALGMIETCSTVAYDTSVCAATNVVRPALQIVKMAPRTALVCEPVTVNYRVTNTGSGTARGVKITDTLPEQVRTKDGFSVVSLNAGDLAAGKSRDFTVKLDARKTGTFKSGALARSASGLEAVAAETTTVVVEPKLVVTQTGPKTAFLGRPFSYEITVTNTGSAEAKDTVLEERLPRGVKVISANGGKTQRDRISWRLGSLAPNAKKTVKVTLSSSTAGKITGTANVTAKCADAARADVATELRGIPAILLEVVDVEDPILVGEFETYEIRVTNQGTAAGTNILITAILEDSMELTSTSGPTKEKARTGMKIEFLPLAKLEPKESRTWKVVVKAKKAGDARFRVQLQSDQMKRPVDESESTNLYE